MSKKRLLLLTGILAIMTVVGLILSEKSTLFEQWYLWSLGSQDGARRSLSATRLGDLKSKRAIVPLINVLITETKNPHDPSLGSYRFQQALVKIGAPAVPALIQVLTNNDPDVRAEIIEILGSIGAEAKEAVPTIIMALRNDYSDKVRVYATLAIGSIRSLSEQAVPALLNCLNDDKQLVRVSAARALGQFGRDAIDALPALTRAIETDDSLLRTEALKAVRLINEAINASYPTRDSHETTHP